MKNENYFTYLVLSDLHLGHNKNKAEFIIKNFIDYFIKYNKQIKDIDVLFLLGDEFDRLINNGTDTFDSILGWMIWLVKYCEKNNIKIRVLEGTSSHSYRQMAMLDTVIKDLNLNVDFKYFDTLTIDYMEEYDLNILYVPDELNTDAQVTYKQVLKLMEEKNLSQVDLMMLHGQFHYQLPFKLDSTHTEENYLPLVKYFISVAHIHKPSINGKILGQGSFDRIAHNEEEDKGGFLIKISMNPDLENEYVFLVNHNARIFKTIEINTTEYVEMIKTIKQVTSKLPKESFLRIKIDKSNPLSDLSALVVKDFPLINLKFDLIDKNKNSKKVTDNLLKNGDINVIYINKDNIEDLIIKELKNKDLSTSYYKTIVEELRQVI